MKIKRNRRNKLILLIMSSLVSLGLAAGIGECYLRYKTKNSRVANPFLHNPIIEAQASEGTFFPDPVLGHRLSPPFAYVFGDEYDPVKSSKAREINDILPSSFIGVSEKKIQTLEEIVQYLNSTTGPIVLNLGDSSTSGWDSDVVTRNRNIRNTGSRGSSGSLESPFFQYQTYSDILAQKGFRVINAGVPGYTSSQGVRCIKRLLKEFQENGISIDYVTIYFGNNDSVWNGNTQDQYVLPAGEFNLKLAGVIKTFSSGTIYPRVDLEDYKTNLRELITTCQGRNVSPILIQPVIPKYWHPGLRAQGREIKVWQAMYKSKGHKIITDLEEAIKIYEEGKWLFVRAGCQEHKDMARDLFIKAQNLDYLVPRIKPSYVQALHEVSEETSVPLVNVQKDIPIDDRSYFVDYCHPKDRANELIAEEIKIVTTSNQR